MGMMSAGLSIIGGIMQGIGAKQAADAEAAAHEYNAKVAERNVVILHQQGVAATADRFLANRREMAMLANKYMSAGITMTGSAMDVALDTLREENVGLQRIGYQTRIAQIEEIDKANLEHMGAESAKKAGSISMVAGILSGVTGAVRAIG